MDRKWRQPGFLMTGKGMAAILLKVEVGRIKQKRGYKHRWPRNIKTYTDDAGNNKGDAVLSYEDPSAAHSAGGFHIGGTMAQNSVPRAAAPQGGYGFSASRCKRYKYDIFLSFRGPDTREVFILDLYAALRKVGFRVFLADFHLERGDYIYEGLRDAMKESLILIPVFSNGYAESKWCLEEVAWMSHEVQERSARVIPCFHQIEPSDVRKPHKISSSFATAFKAHESKRTTSIEKIKEWKSALKDIGRRAGWVLPRDSTISKASFIENMVEDLSKSWSHECPLDLNTLTAQLSLGLNDLMGAMTLFWVGFIFGMYLGYFGYVFGQGALMRLVGLSHELGFYLVPLINVL